MSRIPIPEPNPNRIGACPDCGNYRTDGRPPYLHYPGCPKEGDLQIDRWLDEMASGDLGGPTIYATEADAQTALSLGVAEVTVIPPES